MSDRLPSPGVGRYRKKGSAWLKYPLGHQKRMFRAAVGPYKLLSDH